jgi:heterodisulfide reductase subunit B2
MTYAYYPGCSLKGTGRAYEESLLAVFRILGVDVKELDDWNCCGATTYMSTDELTSYALAGRNLAMATRERQDIVAPCAACYLVLNKTQHYVRDYPHIRQLVERSLSSIGLQYSDSVQVKHPLEVLLNEVGLDAIKAKVRSPLKGLKVAPYYGCQIVRPYAMFDDQVNPTSMDRLLQACGAKTVTYPLKTRCCGGSQKGTLPQVGLDLITYLLTEARKNGAEVVATVCPLCQFNLECFQAETGNGHHPISIPVLYFTQLMALALGADNKSIALQRCLVPVEPLLVSKGIVHA